EHKAGLRTPHHCDPADHAAMDVRRAGRQAGFELRRKCNEFLLQPVRQLTVSTELLFETGRETLALGQPRWETAWLRAIIIRDRGAIFGAEDDRAFIFVATAATAFALVGVQR